MIKAALIGMGNPHSAAHLRTLQVLPEVEEIHIWGETDESLAPLREKPEAKVASLTTNLNDLLARRDILFAIACLRTDVAPDVCLKILAAGKHIMAEKPIGRTAPDVEKVVVAAEKAGLQLGVCYQNRYTPVSLEARRIVRQGLLGPLVSIEMRMMTTQVKARNPQHWLFHKAMAGGGILSWLGCHDIDMMRYVSGDEIVSVSAEVATRSGEAIDVEDIAALSLRFRSGAVGSFIAGYVLALKGGGFTSPSYDTYLGFTGQQGRLYWDSVAKPGRLYTEIAHPDWASAPVRDFAFQVADSPAYGGVSGEAFLRDFILACQGKGTSPTTGRYALQVARIVDAAYESSRTGRRVEIPAP